MLRSFWEWARKPALLKGPGGDIDVGANWWWWFSVRREARVEVSRVAKWLMYFLAVSRRLEGGEVKGSFEWEFIGTDSN